jgi:hypothetical protein
MMLKRSVKLPPLIQFDFAFVLFDFALYLLILHHRKIIRFEN